MTRIKFQSNIVHRSAEYEAGVLGGEPLDTHAAATLIEILDNTGWHSTGSFINVECASAVVRGNISHHSEDIAIRCHNESRYAGRLVVDDNIVHRVVSGQAIVIEEGFASASTAGYTDVSCCGNKAYSASAGILITIDRSVVPVTCNSNITNVTGDGIAIVGEGEITCVGNRGTTGGEFIQLNGCSNFTVSGNVGNITGTASRGILILNGVGGALVGNTLTMPDGSTSQAINVTELGGAPSTDIVIGANMLRALGTNAGIGIFTPDTTLRCRVGLNQVSNFAIAEDLGTGTSKEI